MEDPTTAAPTESAAPTSLGSPAALEAHDFASIFPPMREPEFTALVADIRERGQLEPIWTYQGKVIDGRHRLRACTELGLTPRTREWDGNGSLLEFVISANLRRRHLKENQRAMIAARMLPHFEAEALKRMHHVAEEGGEPGPNLAQARSAEKAGLTLNVSKTSVKSARNLLQSGIPELIARVDAGSLAVSLAAKVAELPAEQQARLVKLSRGEIARELRALQPPKRKSLVAVKEDEKIKGLIQNTQIGPGTQLLNTPQGLRLELKYADCLTEFYRLNSDRYHLLDLLERGVFIVRKKYEPAH